MVNLFLEKIRKNLIILSDPSFQRIYKWSFYLFFLVVVIGYLSSPLLPLESFLAEFQQSLSFLFEMPPFQKALFIFFNNALVSFLAIVLGVVFAIWPIFLLLFNGVLIGAVIQLAAKRVGFMETMALLIPHGIIEIPAFILAISLGIMVGKEAINKFKKKEGVKLTKTLKDTLKVFFVVIIPLLFLAAFVEIYITFEIAKFLF